VKPGTPFSPLPYSKLNPQIDNLYKNAGFQLKIFKDPHAAGRNLRTYKPNKIWIRRTAPHKIKTAIEE
jgi:hypothetical protein